MTLCGSIPTTRTMTELEKALFALQQVEWPDSGCPWTCDCDAAKFFRAAWEAVPALLALRRAAHRAYDRLGYPHFDNVELAMRDLMPFFPEDGP